MVLKVLTLNIVGVQEEHGMVSSLIPEASAVSRGFQFMTSLIYGISWLRRHLP